MILDLILSSGIGGFASSLIAPFVKGYQERKARQIDLEFTKIQNAHELQMLDLSAKNQKELQQMKIEEISIQTQSEVEKMHAVVDAKMQESLYGGGHRMDSFVASVRPVITYSFTLTFLILLWSYAATVLKAFGGTIEAFVTFFDSDFVKGMSYLFANIVTFWFGNRMLEKHPRR